MKHLFPIYGMCSILWLGACTPVATQPEKSLFTTQEDFPNLLNVKNVPEQPVDGDLNLFSDLGAWSGYALPVNQSRAFAGAFIGPMTMHGRGWIAQTLAQPTLVVNGEKYDLVRNMQTAKYLPGKLVQHFKDARLEFTTELCFATSRTAFVRSVITNLSDTPLNVSLTWSGGVFEENTTATKVDKGVRFHYPFYGRRWGTNRQIITLRNEPPVDEVTATVLFHTADEVMTVGNDSLQVVEKSDYLLQSGKSYTSEYSQTLTLKGKEADKEYVAIKSIPFDQCFAENAQRWNQGLQRILSADSPYMKENAYRNIAVKALMTLNSNWRTPAGDIFHGCSFPSYTGFIGGCWSWDAWQIASGNVYYNPEGAKSEMLSLFDYQAENGMVPDFIGVDISLWNNKLELSAEAYIKNTRDMLSSRNISLATGYNSSILVNDGKLRTTGFEMQAIYHGKAGGLKYDLDLNLSHYKSVLKSMANPDYLYEYGALRTYVGGEIGEFWVYQTAGIFQNQAEVDEWNTAHGYKDQNGNWQPLQPVAKPGDIRFIDQNGDGMLDTNDRVKVGSGTPKVSLGFNINLAYKDFDLVANFYGDFGAKRYNYTKYQLERMDHVFNYGKNALNAWTPENPDTDIPRAVSGDPNKNSRTSTRFVENGDYLRLNNLQIGYNLPVKYCKKMGLSNLRIYVGATRLFTITNYKGYDSSRH